MQEVQAVSLGWNIFICLLLICIQVVALCMVCRRHKHEMDIQTGTMAILTASMQPSEIRAHCQRVADLAENIARTMKLPEKHISLVQAIGILHEIDGIESITRKTPLEFSILAVADYFDILTHRHIEPMSLDEAVEEIRMQAGARFDPAIVKVLMRVALREDTELAARQPAANEAVR